MATMPSSVICVAGCVPPVTQSDLSNLQNFVMAHKSSSLMVGNVIVSVVSNGVNFRNLGRDVRRVWPVAWDEEEGVSDRWWIWEG